MRSLSRFVASQTHHYRIPAMMLVCGLGLPISTASAQWMPGNQPYGIQRTGLFGPEQTSSSGSQNTVLNYFTPSGYLTGYSNRYLGNTINGQNTWFYNPSTGTTIQTGLVGALYTGSSGFQYSFNSFQNRNGQVAGYTSGIGGLNTQYGRYTWVWNPLTNSLIQTGLTGAGYVDSQGFQYRNNRSQSDSGFVTGTSNRFNQGTPRGASIWLYSPFTETTTQIGLTDAVHTSANNGVQGGSSDFLDNSGRVAGYSFRYYGPNGGDAGRNTWFYSVATATTVQTGLTSSAHTGSNGYQYSINLLQSQLTGQVAGHSQRIIGSTTFNGQDAWVYQPSTNRTIQVGLVGSLYNRGAGYQNTSIQFQNDAGQVTGSSQRFSATGSDLGTDSWIYRPTAGQTMQIGLVGSLYTGSTGFQSSSITLQSATGYVSGFSSRVTGVSASNGQNTWIYNPSTNSTTKIGLMDAAFTGATGYQYAACNFLNDAGQVAGYSLRITGMTTDNGRNTWAYNSELNTNVKTGLLGSEFTGSAGYQYSGNSHQNATGHVAGYSTRVRNLNTANGQCTWAYNPVTATTVQTGLTDSAYIGTAGYQISVNALQNDSGQVAGYSYRIVNGVSAYGQSAWYFDPLTNLTSAIVGSVRTEDDYAFSQPTILTNDGFLLGNYTFFADGIGNGEQHAFIFRPDLGLTDLGNLVNGGLTDNGWRTLQNPIYINALNTIVGYGYVNGQTNGQSVFIMTIPSPAAATLLTLGGLIASRRRRV